MPALADQLRSNLQTLPLNERAELAHFLIHSLDGPVDNDEGDPDIARAWDVELERRAAEIRDGTAEGQPAEQVFAELRAKHARASSAA